jgi:hypothetical protein
VFLEIPKKRSASAIWIGISALSVSALTFCAELLAATPTMVKAWLDAERYFA